MKPEKLLLKSILLSLFAAVTLVACSKNEEKTATKGVPEVGIVVVKPEKQTIVTELPGRTAAFLSADIRPQISGIIQHRLFREGADVKQGQVLYQIDPAPYKATYSSAQASLSKAQATLTSSRLKAQRYLELNKIDAVSKQDNDDAQSALGENQANVEVARAALDAARINLGYTNITSPISGRIGTSTVTPGALVVAQQATALTTVQKIDPIYVDVTQPSIDVLRLRRELESGQLKKTGVNEVAIKVVLEDGSVYPIEGKLQFTGLSVDPGTGVITLRAVVPNPDAVLLPGMYVRARLDEAIDDNAILIPQKGVARDVTGAASALILTRQGKVERRLLKVGRSVGNRWWVTEGLKSGDKVIVDGLQKVKVGDSAVGIDMTQQAREPVQSPVSNQAR